VSFGVKRLSRKTKELDETMSTRLLVKLAASTVFAACLAGHSAAQTIKIGVNEPLTGPFAASGTYVVNGAKIAADEINGKGGILGKKIELVIEDNKRS
jgi:branched-chain amino acid transport system substrate-binding protein